MLCTDPYVTVDADLVPLDEVLEQADLLVIGAPHRAYADLEPDRAGASTSGTSLGDGRARDARASRSSSRSTTRARRSSAFLDRLFECDHAAVRGARRVRLARRHHRPVPREVRRARTPGSSRRSTPTAGARRRRIRYGIDHADAPRSSSSPWPTAATTPSRSTPWPTSSSGASWSPPRPATSKGGQQVGGPFLKRLMSRVAGLSLYWFARVGTRDATNSFKAYDRDFVREVGIESDTGFEIGLELVAKARRHRLPVAELPTIWLDRTDGPVELQGLGLVAPLPALVSLRIRSEVAHEGPRQRFVRLHRRLRRRGAARPRAHGRRHRQPLEVRPGRQVLRRPPRLPPRRGRRPRRRADDRAARRLRPLHRRRGDDRRDLLLPRLRLRPARHQRADHRRVVRRRHQGPPGGQAPEGHLPELVDGVRVDRHVAVGRGRRARRSPPPLSSYGFQKLAVEYFARAAWDQYQLPYTIVRPFNCVGIGEGRALGDVEVLERQRQAGHEPRRARPRAEDR